MSGLLFVMCIVVFVLVVVILDYLFGGSCSCGDDDY